MPAKSVRECARELISHVESAESGYIPGCGNDLSWRARRDELVADLRLALDSPDLKAKLAAARSIPEYVSEREKLADEKVVELESRLARVTEAYNAACEYIDSNVCDPDITDEMIRTYAAFKRCRAALSDAPDDRALVPIDVANLARQAGISQLFEADRKAALHFARLMMEECCKRIDEIDDKEQPAYRHCQEHLREIKP